MAFRRFNRSGGRSFNPSSRFRRRRPLGRTVTRPRLEMGTFFIEDTVTIPNSSAAETLQYFHLASIATSLGSATSGDASRVGTVLAGMQRRLVIHGLVMDWGIEHQGVIEGGPGPLREDGMVNCVSGLLVDRQVIDSGIPVPASVATWDPWTTTFPTALLSSSTPLDVGEPVNGPTRILFRKNTVQSLIGQQVINQDEGALYVPDDQMLNRQFSTFNKRLRLSLDDEQGLYFFFGTRNSPTFALSASDGRVLRRWLAGTIYYRFQQ